MPSVTLSLQQRVDSALNTAVFENGYTNLMHRLPSYVAEDLRSSCQDLEDEKSIPLALCVLSYQQWYLSRPETPSEPRK